MDPINQKEITSSFIQFMVLFLITVILAIMCVFFDQKFSQDSYKDLQKKYKEANARLNADYLPEMLLLVDSTQQSVRRLDTKNGVLNFNDRSVDQFLNALYIPQKDTTPDQLLGLKVKNVFLEWMADKRQLIRISDLEKDNAKKERKIEKLQTELVKMGYNPDVLKSIE